MSSAARTTRPVGRPPKPPEERARPKIGNFGGAGCWPWLGHVGRHGYGIFSPNVYLPAIRAHRFVYTMVTGENIDGLVLHHRPTCAKSCVNPAHLTPKTQSEHMRDEDSPAGRKMRQRLCKHGHEFTPDNTYIKPNGTRSCRACMKTASRRMEARRPPRDRSDRYRKRRAVAT